MVRAEATSMAGKEVSREQGSTVPRHPCCEPSRVRGWAIVPLGGRFRN